MKPENQEAGYLESGVSLLRLLNLNNLHLLKFYYYLPLLVLKGIYDYSLVHFAWLLGL